MSDEIIRKLSQKVGIPELTFNDEGVVTFVFNDQYKTNIERSEDQEQLTVYGVLGDLPLDQRESCLMALMDGHLFGHQTEGATFAVDLDTEEIILFRTFDVRHLEFEWFYGELQKFLRVQQAWTDKLEAKQYVNVESRLRHY